MAAINNFSLVGIGSSVKLGKGGMVLAQSSGKLTVDTVALATETFVTGLTDALDLRIDTLEGQSLDSRLTAVETKVGDVQYSSINYVALSDSSTVAIGKLDSALLVTNGKIGDMVYDAGGPADIANATNVTDAINAIDAAIASLSGSTLGDEVDAIETAVGLNGDGTFATITGNYTASATTVSGAIQAVDTQVKTNTDAAAALLTEVNLIETSVGLGTTGAFVTITGNYTGSATTVVGAIQAVDTQVKTNADAIADKADTTYVDLQDALKLDLTGGTLTGALILAGAPTTALEAANKGYVDGIAAGLSFKQSALAATTANIASFTATPSVLDGVNLTAGDRILVKDQTDAKQNGIYVVTTLGTGANGVWTRATDADEPGELKGGVFVFVTAGTANADKGFVVTAPDGSVTIGTDNIVWTQYSSTGTVSVSAGTGITVSSSLGVYTVSLADVGTVVPGTYGNATTVGTFTVSAKGQITSAGNTSIQIAQSQVTGLSTALGAKADTITVTALQTEVDAIETGVGLNANGTYTAPVGSNYLGSATTVKDGLVALDTQVKTNTDGIAAKADKTYVDSQDALKAPLASPIFTGTVTVPAPVNATDASTKKYVDDQIAAVQIPGATVTKKVAVSTASGTLVAGIASGAFISRITVKVTTAFGSGATFTATHNSVTVADPAFSDLTSVGVYVIDTYYDAAATSDLTFAVAGTLGSGAAVVYVEYVNP